MLFSCCAIHFQQLWKQYGNNMGRKSRNQNLWVNVLIKQTSWRVCLLFPHFSIDIVSGLRYCSKGGPNYLLHCLVNNQIEVIIVLRHVMCCKLVFVDLKSCSTIVLYLKSSLNWPMYGVGLHKDLNDRKLATQITIFFWSSYLLPWDDCRWSFKITHSNKYWAS
jgi:hypothetical protein